MAPAELSDLLRRYRQGTCTPAERQVVEAWYANQPEGPSPALSAAESMALRQAIWQRLAAATAVAPAPVVPRWRRPASRRWLAAATLAVGLGLGGWWVAGHQRPSVALPVAETQPWLLQRNPTAHPLTVRLPDGSHATLTPASQLRYQAHFADGARTVFLVGEAFFKVQHDAARPFRVYTAGMETRVLGTSFTVRAYPKTATVVQVRTGRVRVSPLQTTAAVPAAVPAAVVVLPNQQAVYSTSHQRLVRELVPQPVLLAPHAFAFDNRPVAEVLEALKQAYGVRINYNASTIANCTINLNLRSQASLFDKLDVLCQATGATYTQTDAQITFLAPNCQSI